MPTISTYTVAGVPIAAVSLQTAVAIIMNASETGRSLSVHLCNAYTLSIASTDERFRKTLCSGELNLADGTPVAWLGRGLGTDGPVRGPALVEAVARASSDDSRHYLYGAAPGVAERMATSLRDRHPQFKAVGVEAPPYHRPSQEELLALVERIRVSRATILWVGVGTPKQDEMVERLAPHVNCPIVPVGAAFDLLAGDVKAAPKILHGSGLEWLYRLSREPWRLWRRYTLGNYRFIHAVLRDHLSRLPL